MTGDELLEIADRVVARAGDGVEAEVTVSGGSEALTRFATSFIHQNVADRVRVVGLRLCAGGRVASASTNQTDADALDRLVVDTLAAAKLAPVDAGWPGLSPAAEAPPVDHWDAATAEAQPAARADRVRAFVDAAGGLETAGYCATHGDVAAFSNSARQRVTGRTTLAALDGIARTGTADGSARAASTRLADLDGATVGGEATRRARDASEPTDLEPGRYEVVLEPGCVANLLTFLAIHGFNGRAVEENRSFVRLGERQFDPTLNLRDDVAHPMAVGVAWDAEGTPKGRYDFVRDGVTAGVAHDRRTAKAAGAESTGHAIPSGAEWGAVPANLVLEPGEASHADLVARMERGLLVTDLWYTRILDPRTQVVTGLTRNGVWLVEDGRVRRPVANLRFTQSYVEALAPGAVRGVGSDLTLVSGDSWMRIPILAPSLHLASWNFTGGARG